ncbi:unnamed protein product [Rotaria sp. Silwood2]|nr:unnamed protein product [Rotaria sp. Silwood2]CAF4320632.1 unnamed protein product [Rotaria sp. Silwood2]
MLSTLDTRAIEYFTAIKNLLQQLYTKPIPKQLHRHAQYMYKMIKSMQQRLRKANIAVGQIDKSKSFFFIDAKEWEEKITNYMNKTNAYQEITSVQPILASINAPARQISSFLDQLLTPIYNYVTKHITLINSIDVVRKLKEYQQQGYLTSTTLFIIFDVADLYKMIPRDGAIAV